MPSGTVGTEPALCPAHLIDAALECITLERAGRRDNSHAVADPQGSRLDHHRNLAISAAIAW
jgi:hypothetical protein